MLAILPEFLAEVLEYFQCYTRIPKEFLINNQYLGKLWKKKVSAYLQQE